MALGSTRRAGDGPPESRIVAGFEPGTIVTLPRTVTFTLVTEYGKLNLKGKSTWERAEGIIGLAHPEAREGLIAEADRLKIWRRSNRIR